MSAFTDFIQTELPLRPFLVSDVPKNSVIIRQGAGPRQLSAITLAEGQILMNLNGTLKAVTLSDVTGSTDSFVHTQETASSTWNIEHNTNTPNFSITVFDDQNKVVVPDDIEVVDNNNVSITFNQFPLKGRAIIIVVRE